MSHAFSRLHKITLSTIYVYKALNIYNEKMNFDRITDCNLILGINFNLIKEYEMAEEYFLKVIDVADTHKNLKITKGKAYHNLGNIYSKQDMPDKAIEMLHRSLYYKGQTEIIRFHTFYLLSKEYLTIGDIENGKKYYLKGVSLSKESNDNNYLLKFSVLYYQFIKPEETRYKSLLKKSVYYFKNVDLDFSRECAELLAEIHANELHYKGAYQYLQMAYRQLNKDVLKKGGEI